MRLRTNPARHDQAKHQRTRCSRVTRQRTRHDRAMRCRSKRNRTTPYPQRGIRRMNSAITAACAPKIAAGNPRAHRSRSGPRLGACLTNVRLLRPVRSGIFLRSFRLHSVDYARETIAKICSLGTVLATAPISQTGSRARCAFEGFERSTRRWVRVSPRNRAVPSCPLCARHPIGQGPVREPSGSSERPVSSRRRS